MWLKQHQPPGNNIGRDLILVKLGLSLMGQEMRMDGNLGHIQLIIPQFYLLRMSQLSWLLLPKLSATKRKAKRTTPELFSRIIICQISTIWDLGPVRIHKCSSDGRTPGQIFRIGVLILNHYHWQAAAFFFFFLLNPELKFNFLNFMKRNEKYPGGKRVAQERFWTSKTLKNLLMI